VSVPTEVLPYFQGLWAERMVDSCVVKEPAGPGVFDPDTGLITPGYATIYDGACLIRPAAAGSATFGEERVATFEYTVFVPHTVEGIEPGQLVDVSSTHDPELDGRQLVIDNVSRDSYVTIRRLACTEAPQDAS
jgi:hypothetical protein